jgi:DNA polymerase-3 subunit delta
VKLPPARVEGFLARPDPEIATVLLYGSDAGLVAERARKLARQVVDALDDPFRVSELAADDLRQQPGRLVEEAQALCLMGGRRLVRVRDAGDGLTGAVRDLLALADQAGFVLLEAAELGGSSSLRRLAERSPRAAALPCYLPTERDLEGQVQALLAEHGLEAAPDALAYLVANLGSDRALTRGEIEKLALYLADVPGGKVSLADAAAAVGDSSALRVDDAALAALLGQRGVLEEALERLLGEGQSPSRILRATATLVSRLLRLRAEIAGGVPLDAAFKAARPPFHFTVERAVRAALTRWSGDALMSALALLQAAETRCRSTGAPEALICRAALAQLATLIGPQRRS